ILALLADHHTRTGRVNGDMGSAGRTGDLNAAHRGAGEFLLQKLAHLEVDFEEVREVFLVGVPLGGPVGRDPQADAGRMYFLTHDPLLTAPPPAPGYGWCA